MTNYPWLSLPNIWQGHGDIAKVADLEWEYSIQPVHVHWNGNYIEVPGNKCGIRSDTGAVVSPLLGNRPKEFQPAQFIETVHRIGEPVFVGTLKGGTHLWAFIRIGDPVEVNGRMVTPTVLYSHPYAYSESPRIVLSPLIEGIGTLRPIQSSGLSLSLNPDTLDSVQSTADAIDNWTRAFAMHVGNLRNTNVDLDEKHVTMFMLKCFDPEYLKKVKSGKAPARNRIVDIRAGASQHGYKIRKVLAEDDGILFEPECGNLWNYLMLALWSIEWKSGHNIETCLESSWFGKYEQMKVDILTHAITMAVAYGSRRNQ